MAEKKLQRGDEVEWETAQGTTEGTVQKKVTSDTSIKGHRVRASENDPQYVVKSAKTGAKAAHKPEALEKKS